MMKKKLLSILAACAVAVSSVTSLGAVAEEEKKKVTFNEMNGSETYSIEVEPGTALYELPGPVLNGDKEFAGWYLDAEYRNEYHLYQNINEDTTLYAKWAEPMLFTDIADHPLAYAIRYVYTRDIMKGVSDTEFAPDMTLTRAMLVTILYRSEGEPAFMNDQIFADVPQGAYYEKAVAWAQGKELVYGVSDTEFAPDMNITREQLAAILYRYALYKGLDTISYMGSANANAPGDIADISEYAMAAMDFAIGAGVLSDNRTKGMILPTADATRAEAANAILAVRNLPPLSEERAFEGFYNDAASGRALLLALYNEETEKLNLSVYWPDSAAEAMMWDMSASFDADGYLRYDDCIKRRVIADEDGDDIEEILYENGSGYFSVSGDALLWDGAEELECRSSIFVQDLMEQQSPLKMSTASEIYEMLGFSFREPEGATELSYYIMNGTVGGMMFALNDGTVYCDAGIAETNGFTNISGIELTWDKVEPCTVNGFAGQMYYYADVELGMQIRICMWYDEATGLMYYATTEAEDLREVDTVKVAEAVYAPVHNG